MQQMYYCPNCRAPVAYGQTQCSNCKTVLNWQASQTQDQYAQQQQQWHQASTHNQPAGSGSQGRHQPQEGDGGLLYLLSG